jgi:hypothetical protein
MIIPIPARDQITDKKERKIKRRISLSGHRHPQIWKGELVLCHLPVLFVLR